MKKRLSAGIAIGVALFTGAVAYADTSDIAQKAGTAGCVSETGTAGQCLDGAGLGDASAVAVSPDGEHVYAVGYTAETDGSVAILDRDAVSGALSPEGCVSQSGSGGECAVGRGLMGPSDLAISPDGLSVYVASFWGDTVAIFDRDPATGALTQEAGTAGCIANDGQEGCQDVAAMAGPRDVIVSPDGASVYVAAGSHEAVGVFDRAAGGGLTQKDDTAACISSDGSEGECQNGTAIGATSLAISPDGTSVYAAGQFVHTVAILDRSTGTGALSQEAGTAGCVSEDGTDGVEPGVVCVDAAALQGAQGLALSPGGTTLYVAAQDSHAVAIFDRAAGGALTQKAAELGCISETGTGGVCQDGYGLKGAIAVEATSDGASVYVAGSRQGTSAADPSSSNIAIFDRDVEGELTQRPGTLGCLEEPGSATACRQAQALDGVAGLASSANGQSLYSAAIGADAVAAFDRGVEAQFDRTVTLEANKGKVKKGKRVTLTAELESDGGEACTSTQEVALEARKGSGDFKEVGLADSDAQGVVTFKEAVRRETTFRANVESSPSCGGATSNNVKVKVKKR